jgi:HTH DNA binding domain
MWLQQFTVAHPDTIVEVRDRLEVGHHRILFEVEIPTEGRIGWGEELRHLPHVRLVELIDTTPSSEIYRVLFAGPTFIPLIKKLKLMRHFPFPIQAGVATWNVVGPELKIDKLLQQLGRSRIGVAIESVHRGPPARGASTLTPRQRQILRWAVAEGYFDVPRRISLTMLAPKIGVATSTLSVSLAVIEKKIVEWNQWSSESGDSKTD